MELLLLISCLPPLSWTEDDDGSPPSVLEICRKLDWPLKAEPVEGG